MSTSLDLVKSRPSEFQYAQASTPRQLARAIVSVLTWDRASGQALLARGPSFGPKNRKVTELIFDLQHDGFPLAAASNMFYSLCFTKPESEYSFFFLLLFFSNHRRAVSLLFVHSFFLFGGSNGDQSGNPRFLLRIHGGEAEVEENGARAWGPVWPFWFLLRRRPRPLLKGAMLRKWLLPGYNPAIAIVGP